MHRHLPVFAAAFLVSLCLPAAVHAQYDKAQIKCHGAIVKTGVGLFKAYTTEVAKCRHKKDVGALPPETVCAAGPKTDKALAALAELGSKACADVTPASLGFDECVVGGTITTMADLSSCLVAFLGANMAASLDQTMSENTAPPLEAVEAKCHAAYLKAAPKALLATFGVLSRCQGKAWKDGVVTTDACIDDFTASMTLEESYAALAALLTDKCTGADIAVVGVCGATTLLELIDCGEGVIGGGLEGLAVALYPDIF